MNIYETATKEFETKFKKKWGADSAVYNSQESSYNLVYLWKKEFEQIRKFYVGKVKQAIIGEKLEGQLSSYELMPNYTLAHKVRIGEFNAKGNIDTKKIYSLKFK